MDKKVDDVNHDNSGSKSFKLFGHLIMPYGAKKLDEGSSSAGGTTNSNVGSNDDQNQVYKGVYLGPKVLTKSDTDSSSRLLLGRDLVLYGIIRFLDQGRAKRCETVDGAKIHVHDLDTHTDHELVLKMWKSNSFVFTGNWNKDFVRRRNLQKNDEIGLYWDKQNSRLNFTLLKKDVLNP